MSSSHGPGNLPNKTGFLKSFETLIPTIGVGTSFDFQMFDREQLYAGEARFMLAGIVNRMDRAYVAPESCGEIRLIYRLTRTALCPPTGFVPLSRTGFVPRG